MVQRRVTKSCCGGRNSLNFTLLKPVRREHVNLFVLAGFQCPDNYIKSGLLYAKKDGFIGTATFGICNINVRCTGANCQVIINEFESILKTIEQS
jgi:hypothetical protein